MRPNLYGRRRMLLRAVELGENARWAVTYEPDAIWPGRPWVITGPGRDAVMHRAHTHEDAMGYARWRATRHRYPGRAADRLANPTTYRRKRMSSGWPVIPAKVDLR